MLALFKEKDRFSEELLLFMSRFLQADLEPVYWGQAFDAHAYHQALQNQLRLQAEAQASETPDQIEIPEVDLKEFVDPVSLAPVLEAITAGVKPDDPFPPMVFDHDTWSVFRSKGMVLPIVPDLDEDSYGDLAEVLATSPMVYFIDREDYLQFRDDYPNTAWLSEGKAIAIESLMGCVLRINQQTDRQKVFKGLALSQQLESIHLPLEAVVLDENNTEMLALIQAYFPDLAIWTPEKLVSNQFLSIYLYGVADEEISQLEPGFFYRNRPTFADAEPLEKMAMSNRSLTLLTAMAKDALENIQRYVFVPNRESLTASWQEALQVYADEAILTNQIDELTQLDDQRVLLKGHLIFDKPIQQKAFEMQVALLHRSTKNPVRLATEVQVTDTTLTYSAIIDFAELDFFKGNFDVYGVYDSWNLRIRSEAIYPQGEHGEELLALLVLSREIKAKVKEEKELYFSVSAYLVE